MNMPLYGYPYCHLMPHLASFTFMVQLGRELYLDSCLNFICQSQLAPTPCNFIAWSPTYRYCWDRSSATPMLFSSVKKIFFLNRGIKFFSDARYAKRYITIYVGNYSALPEHTQRSLFEVGNIRERASFPNCLDSSCYHFLKTAISLQLPNKQPISSSVNCLFVYSCSIYTLVVYFPTVYTLSVHHSVAINSLYFFNISIHSCPISLIYQPIVFFCTYLRRDTPLSM